MFNDMPACEFCATLKAGEREANLNWDAEQTEQVKAWLPEEPEPGSRG
jgi:hypothetical protein